MATTYAIQRLRDLYAGWRRRRRTTSDADELTTIREALDEADALAAELAREQDRRSDVTRELNAALETARTVEIANHLLQEEIARLTAVPPDVEAAIESCGDICYERGHVHAGGDSSGRSTDREAAERDLRAAIARAIADARAVAASGARQPATVGGLLATAPVGSIVEYVADNGRWTQVRVDEDRDTCTERARVGAAWRAWNGWPHISVEYDDMRLPARLVPADQADADPATRGPIGGGR